MLDFLFDHRIGFFFGSSVVRCAVQAEGFRKLTSKTLRVFGLAFKTVVCGAHGTVQYTAV